MARYLAEFFGTLILVLFGCGAVVLGGDHVGQLGIALSFGFAIVALAYGLGPISGGHVNPAVSLAVFVAGRMTAREMIGYWVAQFAGALAGAALLLLIVGTTANGLGQDGFGFVFGRDKHIKVPQTGRVLIQNDVEIGAGTTIDRGSLRDTVIGEGTKIDNQVQIGHNVTIGRHCLLAAQIGLAGSLTIGDNVALGAKVGINNHLRIGDGAQVTAMSGVKDDIPANGRWGGFFAKPTRQWFREIVAIERLTRDGSADPKGEGRE